MKMITAVIKPFKLDDVRDALNQIGIAGMTVEEVKGYGRQKGTHRTVPWRRVRGGVSTQDQAATGDQRYLVENAIEAICSAANTGKIGDGKILSATWNRAFVFAPARPVKTPFDDGGTHESQTNLAVAASLMLVASGASARK